MPNAAEASKTSVKDLLESIRDQILPLGGGFFYFSLVPAPDEDLRPYLSEPIGSLPPDLRSVLPPIAVVLVPYLEKNTAGEFVTFQQPPAKRFLTDLRFGGTGDAPQTLVFATREEPVSEYHYTLYRTLAEIAVPLLPAEILQGFRTMIETELKEEVRGEVDRPSWDAKQLVLNAGKRIRQRLLDSYVRTALTDTLVLYLHGICCDIDVETGPRQIPSPHLRRRLEYLHRLLPPPEGRAVFPEQLRAKR